MAEPVSGIAHEFPLDLFSADGTGYQVNPTLAIGDVKVSQDGGATFSNITTLPVVFSTSGSSLKVNLSIAEMTATKYVSVKFVDAAGSEWQDKITHISVVGQSSSGLDTKLDAIQADLDNGTDGLGALKGGIDGVPTVAEMDARTLLAASYFDPAADIVANVTTVGTTTTNTDMRGTDSANTTTPPTVAAIRAEIDSNSTQLIAIKAKTDAIPVPLKKNTAFPKFPFMMVNTTDNPLTGLAVTMTRSIDGGAFGASTNPVVEVANGAYYIDLSAADTNGNAIIYRFTAATAKDLFFTVITNP